MALDGIVIYKLVESLNQCTPMRINKIYSLGKQELLFNVRTNEGNKKLVISGDSNQNRIHFTKRNYTHDQSPTNFAMLLRKHLINGQITSIIQYNYDRIIRLQVDNYNSIGDSVVYFMYIELMGRYANIILTDKDNMILDAIKRISPLDNPNTAIVPGAVYEAKYQFDKKDIFETTSINLSESLVKNYAGVSPTLEKEIRYRILNKQNDSKIVIDSLKKANHLVISKDNNNKSDFHIIELSYNYNTFITKNFEEGFDIYYYEKSQQERIKQNTQDLLKFLRKEIKKRNKKLIKLQEELVYNKNSTINLKYGDLITTYQHQIKKGMPYANLIDYDTDQEVTIDLDVKLSPIDNAQKYYKLYRKQSNSIKHLTNQIQLAEEEIEYFDLLIQQLSFADINSAKEIREELINKKYIHSKEKHKNAKKKLRPEYTNLTYKNYTLKLGKNNIQNDYITKNSNRNHYWFHVKDYHGSHVVVESEELTEDIIEFASILATYYSKARDLNYSEVNYTQIKNVKRTSTKGLVQLKDFKTCTVKSDYSKIEAFI